MSPIIAGACYRVTKKGNGAWSFLGKVPYSKRKIRHCIIFAIAIIALIGWGGSGGEASTRNVSSAEIASPTSSYSTGSATDSAQSVTVAQFRGPVVS